MPIIQEHPLFTEYKRYYEQYEDFFKGGRDVELNLTYLPQHPYESDAQYKIRSSLATYKNLAKPVVSVFSSSVWRRQPVRELGTELEKYIDDVDGRGFNVNTFFHETSSNIAGYGLQFVLIDSTKAPDSASVVSRQDAAVYGLRPILVPVSPLDVIAWGHDDNNQLIYAVIRESTIRNDTDNPFGDYERVETYKVWYRDKWELWELGDTQTAGFQKIDEGYHSCGVVPLVAGYFKRIYDMIGESCFADVLSLIKRVYILENTLDKSLFDTAFPQQGFFGFDAEDVKNYIRASSNGLVSSDPSANSSYIEPSGRAFQALTEKILMDEKAIREIALRMVRPDSKQIESADSKKLDKQQLDSQLTVFSRNCESFELNCWKIFAKWLEMSDAEIENISIKYNVDFDIEKITSDIFKIFADMRKTGDLSRETYWQILKDGEIPLPEDFDAVEEQARIESDSRSNTTIGQAGRNFLTGTKL